MAPIYSLSAFLLLLAGICLAEVISLRPPKNVITDLSTRVRTTHGTGNHQHDAGYAFAGGTIGGDDAELLDIVLVASVDGKLHALNRTSGDTLWSMSSKTSGAVVSTNLGPLIRTEHPEHDPDMTDDDSEDGEVYVIEPQSGEIYVMSSPDTPLQRLPFSMPQLVDMSPFSFTTENDKRMFVGKKESSLLLVELETGRVKATLNSECPWDPFEDIAETSKEFDDLDLDELDGTKPPKSKTNLTEVFIGRTDYHISIYSNAKRGGKSPFQRLSFSTYGPDKQDHGLQSIYRRTADDAYVESFPNGKIMSFRANFDEPQSTITPNTHLMWAQAFANPIVAIFDVLKSPNRQHPFVLLQPRPRLQDILPNVDLVAAAKRNQFPNLDAAYVGIVEETGSLYAMSPDRYPLVIFGDTNLVDDYGVGRSIDPPPGIDFDPDRDFVGDVDEIARQTKLRQLRRMCRNGSKDIRCLTGVRRLESSRLSRLLDGAPSVTFPPYQHDNSQYPLQDQVPASGNASTLPPRGIDQDTPKESFLGSGTSSQAFSAYAVTAFALLCGLVWLGLVKRRSDRSSRVSLGQSAASQNGSALPVGSGSSLNSDQLSQHSPPAIDKKEAASEPAVTSTPDFLEPFATPTPTTPSTPKPISTKPLARDDVTPSLKVGNGELGDEGEGVGDGDGEESDGDAPAAPGRKKPQRRKRGKRKKGGAANGTVEDAAPPAEEKPMEPEVVHVVSPSAIVVPPPTTPVPVVPSLIVSDTVLGFGSHGTVVFKGSLQGRAVAVKRLLQDFVTLADREVAILQESDDHPNVIRYYYQEAHPNFLYIALELCPASLADVIERPDQFREISITFDPKKALRQITSGLRHLHALKIIHRDIKPQNILISNAKKGVGENAGHRMLISDFGLCKRLEVDQTSFLPTGHGAMAAGTFGWRAPEILRGEVSLDSGTEDSLSSRGSVGTATASDNGSSNNSGQTNSKPARLSKAIDIFALGCLFYYVLSNGGHPFGDRFEREVNILKDAKSLDGLERFGEEGSEATDLITQMLSPDAKERPDTSTCLIHPYFWDPAKRLNFLQDVSDRFEAMNRDPPRDQNLIELERGAINIVGPDWNARLDKFFIENLGKFRKYDGKSVQDLLRALRNKKHHYQDLPDNVKRQIGPMPEGFLSYFTRRFPRLFLHVHSVVAASPVRYEHIFRTYFELSD
ncbi:hypothetical protein C8Q75DRAFT_747312 [Abortiporus biennis]|nr:hypothetical protein C8Q75DRAFT_747312 [Abortiporus biennis]